MCGFQRSLLADQALFVMCGELLVLRDLFLDLCDLCLERGFFQGLGFLVGVDLLFGNELVKGFAGVLCDDAVDFGCGVLQMNRSASFVWGRLDESLTSFLEALRKLLQRSNQ